MNLLFGVLAIGAVGFLLRFLVALYKDEKVSTSRSVTIYLADEKHLEVHKITGRRHNKLTVMDGGVAARILPPPPDRQNVIAKQTFHLTEHPGTKRSTLRQG